MENVSIFLISINRISPPKLKCDVYEIKHENQDKAGQEHSDRPKDPQKQRKGEVAGTQP